MLLFLRSCAVAASFCATSPLLNSTRSISFNAVLSLCYSVKGHAIGICHQCVPSWCLALTAHSPIFSVALPPVCLGTRQRFCIFGKPSVPSCLCSYPLSLIFILLCAHARQGKGEHSSPYGHTLCPLPSGTSRPTSSHSSHRCGAGIFLLLTVRSFCPCHLLPFSVLTSLRRLLLLNL